MSMAALLTEFLTDLYGAVVFLVSGRFTMLISKILNTLSLSPRKAPDWVRRRPIVTLGLGVILLTCSIWMIFGWFEGRENLLTLAFGLIFLGYSVSLFRVWSVLRSDSGKSPD